MEYPEQMENEGPTAMEITLVIAAVLGILYGAYKLVTHSPVIQAATETVASGSLGVSTIAGMLK